MRRCQTRKVYRMELSSFTWISETVSFIEDWVSHMKTKSQGDYKKSVFLYGPPGIGKTTMARIILEKHNFNIVELNASIHRNMSHIDKILREVNSKSTVHKLVNNKGKRNAIIMDEVDGLSIGEKSGLTRLLKYLKSKENMYIPIICISNEKIDKKLKELKKFSHTFFVNNPTKQQMMDIAISIANQNEVNYTRQGLNVLIEKANGDIRILRNLFDLIDIDLSDQVINAGSAKFLISRLSKQHYFKTTNDFLKDVIGHNIPKEEIIANIERHQFSLTEKSMISMMLHENLPQILQSNTKTTPLEKIEKYTEYLELFSNLDYWNSQIFNKQLWEHGNLIQDCSIIPILSELTKSDYKKQSASSIKFTKILGKHSTIYSVLKSSYKFADILHINSDYWLEKIPFLCNALSNERHQQETIEEEDRKYPVLDYILDCGLKPLDIQKFFKYNYMGLEENGYCRFVSKYMKKRKINEPE